MSCPACDDTGFVDFIGQYKTKNATLDDVAQVRRCERYVEYFTALIVDLGIRTATRKVKLKVIGDARPARGCGAAVQRHRDIIAAQTRREEA